MSSGVIRGELESHSASADEPINFGYVFFLTCTAALGGLLFGFDVAIITGAGPFLAQAFSLGSLGLGWAFSCLLFGCIIGCTIAGRLGDRYGRRKLLIVVAVLFAVTSIATALAPDFTTFVIARILGGVAVGGVSLLSPTYVAEVAPPSVRGRMSTMYQMSIVVGIILSYGINYLLRDAGADNWRWMFSTGVVPSALFLILLLLAPETPRFLVMAGDEESAFKILQRIGGTRSAQTQLAHIRSTMHASAPTWHRLMRPGVRRALTVSIGLALLIHLSGINTIIDYAPSIFQSAGWKMQGALASTLLVGVTQFVFTLVSFWAIDRYGRKPLYMVGSFGMALALLALVIAVVTGHFEGMTVLVVILAYLACFAACIGPVFWTLLPEIFANDVRATALIVPVMVQWLANAVVVLVFPYVFYEIGKVVTFSFLALMSLAQGIFAWRYVPETRNRELEDIEQYWHQSAIFFKKT